MFLIRPLLNFANSKTVGISKCRAIALPAHSRGMLIKVAYYHHCKPNRKGGLNGPCHFFSSSTDNNEASQDQELLFCIRGRVNAFRMKTPAGDGLIKIELFRPDKLNSLDIPMFEAIAETASRIRDDRSIRAVILCGAGRAFCSGLDVVRFELYVHFYASRRE
jgi:hypothetical protein